MELQQQSEADNQVIRGQNSVTFPAQEEPYQFDLLVSKDYVLSLEASWNMISLVGQPLAITPSKLKGDSQTAVLPMFGWHTLGFSYQPVEEFKHGEGYWMLSWNQQGERLVVPVEEYKQLDSYTIDLKAGWNLIGGVGKSYDFSNIE